MEELLGGGFWSSLMGLLAHKGQATIGRVIDLAAKQPFSVTLDIPDARRLLNLGKLAKTAGRNWLSGGTAANSRAPFVPIPGMPAIEGLEQGPFAGSVIVRPLRQGMPPINVTFSMQSTAEGRHVFERIREFLLANEDRYRNDSEFQEFLQTLRDVPYDWATDREDLIESNWVVRWASEEVNTNG